MISTADLRKSFRESSTLRFWERREITALDGVDLRVNRGEIVALLGRNGAGKTTLLKILATLVLPSAGTARIADIDVAQNSALARAHIGLLTGDERSFYWRLTGHANLELFAALNDIPRHRIPSRVSEALELAGLSGRAHTSFKSYSTGMRQRLALARCLLHNPPVLLMDEPTKGLDPPTKSRFLELLRDELANKQGKTILLTTHNIEEVDAADRVDIIHNGKIVASLPPSEKERIKKTLDQNE